MSVTTIEEEFATRVIPWSERELAWQRNRPAVHRVSPPRTGDRVFFRLRRFEMNPCPAVVVDAPDLERGWRWEDLEPGQDTPDGWTWQLMRDNFTGAPRLDAMGLPRVQLLPDPQPVIVCRVEGLAGLQSAREARLRGSPGWLPLDWRERWRPGPHTDVFAGPGTTRAGWNLAGPQQRIPFVMPDGQMLVVD